MTVGDRIKSIRKCQKLSQSKFAVEIGYSQGYLRDIELSKVKPSRRILEAISHRFNVSIDWLLSGEGQSQKKKPRYPGITKILLRTYTGKDKEIIEGLLNEGEYPLFQRIVATKTVLLWLDDAFKSPKNKEILIGSLANLRDRLNDWDDDLISTLNENLDDIENLKNLAAFAFAEEGSVIIFDFFYTFLSFQLESWDFDFKMFTLKIKLQNVEWISIPLL